MKAGEFRRTFPTPGALAQTLVPTTRQTPALEAIDAALADLADAPEDRGRQMIFLAPQEGKSSRTSNWFPLWMLAQDPTLRIAIVSYSATKAERWGRWLRRAIESYGEPWGLKLAADSRAVDRFETTAGGQVVCVGVGGGLAGEQVDLLIIDDPIRGRAEAESKTYREAAWDWWESVGSTRLSARGKAVLMTTRWHADDIAGRLLNREPGQWKVLRIPAVRDPGAPLVRSPEGQSVYSPQGELISVQRRRPGYYLELQQTRSSYVWNSIYMQTPVSAGGNLFKRDDARFWHRDAADMSHHDPTGGQRVVIDGVRLYVGDMTRFVTMDLAASEKTSADYTVACVWGITLGGWLVLLDRKRERVPEEGHFAFAAPLCSRWAAPDVYVERGFIGTTLVRDATAAGMRIQPLTPDKDKVTRALPATQRLKSHTVFFPAGADWLDEWLDELADFPVGQHDDQVDCFAYAARIVSAHWSKPQDDEPQRTEPSTTRALADAYQASTGLPSGVDPLMSDW